VAKKPKKEEEFVDLMLDDGEETMVPETAPAAAASSGEVPLSQPVDSVQQVPQLDPEKPMVRVKLKQDVILNGRMFAAGGTYMMPADAWHVWKYAADMEE